MDIHDDAFPGLRRVAVLLLLTLAFAAVVSLLVDVLPAKSAIALSELVLILPTAYFLRRDGYPLRRIYRLRPVRLEVLAYAGVAAIGLTVLTDWLDRVVQPWVRRWIPMPEGLEQILEDLLRAQTPYEWVFILFGAVILAGLFEEMLFRGMLQGAIERRMGGVMAIIVASLVFALFHLNPWWFIQIALLGAVFGVATWRTGSIFPSALMHAINNFISILFVNIPESRLTWYTEADQVRSPVLFVAVLLVAFGGWQFWKVTEARAAPAEDFLVSEFGDQQT